MPKSDLLGVTAVASGETAERVVRAARECFGRYGVQRTTMSDVAKAARISRQTLYNIVSGREELVEAVMVWRIREIADLLREAAAGQPTITDAIVETSVAAVELGRSDPELTNLVETTGSARLFEMIAGPVPAINDLVGRLFPPLFEQARRRGELRAELDDDHLVEWIRMIYLSLILRTDLDGPSVRHAVRTFLLPSLTGEAAPCAGR